MYNVYLLITLIKIMPLQHKISITFAMHTQNSAPSMDNNGLPLIPPMCR